MKLFNIFRTKKSQIYEIACNNFRSLWDSGRAVEFERMTPGRDYIRMAGQINGVNYQIHINSAALSDRLSRNYKKIMSDNDTELIRIFALACACADLGYYYKDFAALAQDLVLNFSRPL